MLRKLSILFFASLLWGMSACTDTTVQPEIPSEGGLDVPAIPGGDLPPAVADALEMVREQLGVASEQVEVVSFTQMDWPDGCLGLAEPDEACTLAIVPGWQLMVLAAGTTYEVRTNLTGDMIRWRVQ